MKKIQCSSCGSIDFEKMGNNTLKCRYCGSLFAFTPGEAVSQIGMPQKMPYSCFLNGDVLRNVDLTGSERPPIIKVPEGTRVLGEALLGYGQGVFEDLNKRYEHTETTYTNNSIVQRIVKDSLEEVILPEGLEIIGDSTFKGCTNLKHINIPSTVKTIGNKAFEDCKALHEITLPESLTSLGGSVFSGTGLRTITIPGGVKSIVGGAFDGCQELRTVTFSPGVTQIDNGVFRYCSSLETVHLSRGLIELGKYETDSFFPIFQGCTSLKELLIPDSVKYFNANWLNDCVELEKLYIGDNTYSRGFNEEFFKNHPKLNADVPYTRWKRAGRCPYCGGSFSGLLTKKCRKCGKIKGS